MEQDSPRVRLTKLAADGGNWVMYCDRLIWALQAHSISDHVVSATAPTAYIALGQRDGLDPDARWAKEEGQIKQVLCLTLLDTAFNKIKAATTVHDAWTILKRIYEERSKALVADVIRRFRNKRCEESESVCTHFEFLADLREQLTSMGKAVDDSDYTDTLLASLPPSYDAAVSLISASAKLGSKTLTAEVFEQFIIDEYEHRQVKTKHTGESKDKAMNAQASGKKKMLEYENTERAG
jgi:hypothetical protein